MRLLFEVDCHGLLLETALMRKNFGAKIQTHELALGGGLQQCAVGDRHGGAQSLLPHLWTVTVSHQVGVIFMYGFSYDISITHSEYSIDFAPSVLA